MCGIIGLWNTSGESIDPSAFLRSAHLLQHRGPDDEGYFLADTRRRRSSAFRGPDTIPGLSLPSIESADGPFDLALGFRRLSILDLTATGHQPMSTPDGRFTLVFNGEIYNYLELRRELQAAGLAFHSHGDSEVLLAALATWGASALRRLVGMFAFALYDRDNTRLLIGRDCFGIKPLYFTRDAGRFAFASELHALLQLSGAARRVEPQRLYNYLRFGLSDDGDTTILAGVQQLPAAHYMELTPDTIRTAAPVNYWRIDPSARAELSFEDAAKRLRELFVHSVRLHLRSDVQVGACLSGGIDSSAIVCTMRHLAPQAEIHTFSYCAGESGLDEEQWVDRIAAHARTTVHKIRLDELHLAADLERLIHTQQTPFGSTSIYAQHRVFRLASEAGIKVMLDGQGADELLAGYRPYAAARIATLFREARLCAAARLAGRVGNMPGSSLREVIQQTAGLLLPDDWQEPLRALLRRERIPGWLHADWFAARGVTFDLLWRSAGPEALREMLLDSLTRTNLPMLLRYEDRNSMAYSIESRVPFLTPDLAEFIFSLPEEFLIDDQGVSKSVFRAAMRGIVPDAILDRRDKIGFATPELAWLKKLRDWVQPLFDDDARPAAAVLNLPAIRAEWNAALAGRARFDARLWRWINLITWSDEYNVEFGA